MNSKNLLRRDAMMTVNNSFVVHTGDPVITKVKDRYNEWWELPKDDLRVLSYLWNSFKVVSYYNKVDPILSMGSKTIAAKTGVDESKISGILDVLQNSNFIRMEWLVDVNNYKHKAIHMNTWKCIGVPILKDTPSCSLDGRITAKASKMYS